MSTELDQYPVNRIGAGEPEGEQIEGEGGIGQAGSAVIRVQAAGCKVWNDPAERGRRVSEDERAGESEDDGRKVGPLGGEESGGNGREADDAVEATSTGTQDDRTLKSDSLANPANSAPQSVAFRESLTVLPIFRTA